MGNDKGVALGYYVPAPWAGERAVKKEQTLAPLPRLKRM